MGCKVWIPAFAGMTNTLLQKTQKGATQTGSHFTQSPPVEIGFDWVCFFCHVLVQFVVSPFRYRVNDVKEMLRLGSFRIIVVSIQYSVASSLVRNIAPYIARNWVQLGSFFLGCFGLICCKSLSLQG